MGAMKRFMEEQEDIEPDMCECAMCWECQEARAVYDEIVFESKLAMGYI